MNFFKSWFANFSQERKAHMSKSVAVTGHTGTVGSVMYDYYQPNCLGFSRSNGYDIRSEQDKIFEAAKDCDVFINCAHGGPGYAQTELFYMFYRAWRQDSTKTIINIGSDNADRKMWSMVRREYPAEKAALLSAVETAQTDNHKCHVSLINPNVVTDAIKQDLPAVTDMIIYGRCEVKSINLQ